jgi:hypothetical protein
MRDIGRYKSGVCVNFWGLGSVCQDMRNDRAWLAAKDGNGRTKYRSFDMWATEACGLSKTQVYGLINLVESFTREQVDKFGGNHLLALTSADLADRPFLIRELETRGDEITPVEFGKLITTARAARRTTKLKPRKEPTTRTLEHVTATPKAVTAVFPLERSDIDMFARIQAGESTKPATDMSDQPWGKMELENGVALFFGLARRADGQFVLTVQATRNDD